MAFTTLAHYIDIEWLKEAYRRTRKDGAVGVDGQTAGEYAANLEGNLRSLLDRAKSGDHYDLAGALRRAARLSRDPWEGWDAASTQELPSA